MLSLLSRMVSGGDTEEQQRSTADDDVFRNMSSPSSSCSYTDTDEDSTPAPTPSKINIHLMEVGEDALATQVGELSVEDETEGDLDEDSARRVLELVEYYLSDDHLVRDMFLLKHVTRHNEGYVSVKLLAAYKKVKRVARGWRGVAEALRDSKTLQLSQDATKVRRLAPLSALLHQDTRPFRMVLVAGVNPDKASISILAEFFAKFGDVIALQLHRPGGHCLPEVRKAEQQHSGLMGEICVLVEYEKVHQARHAVKHLLNTPECGMWPVELPRPSPRFLPRPQSHPITTTTPEGESTYYSTSDFSEPSSPNCHTRPLPRMWSPFSPYSSMTSSASPSPMFNRCHARPQQQQQSSPESSPPSPYMPRSGMTTPGSSPESQLDARCCLHPPGSSPLPRRILPPPSSHLPRDILAPRRGSGGPGSLSPWLRRRNMFSASKGVPSSARSSPSASPSLRRRHDTAAMIPDNITRFPRGPDGSKGFVLRRNVVPARV